MKVACPMDSAILASTPFPPFGLPFGCAVAPAAPPLSSFKGTTTVPLFYDTGVLGTHRLLIGSFVDAGTLN